MEPNELTEADLEYRRLMETRGSLGQYIDEFVQVEREIRDSHTIRALLAASKRSFDKSLNDLLEASPHDTVEISRCLVNLKAVVLLKRTLELIKQRGEDAIAKLREQDESISETFYGGNDN